MLGRLLPVTTALVLSIALTFILEHPNPQASNSFVRGAQKESGGLAEADDPVARFIRRMAGNGDNAESRTLSKATKRSGFGLVTGVAAGYATRKVGQSAAIIGGTFLIVLQGLAHVGFVKVNWEKIENAFGKFTDLNNDGKLNHEDLLQGWQKAKSVLTTEMLPSAAGFSAGFAVGLLAL